MKTLSTIAKAALYARSGDSIRDQYLAFLLAGLRGMRQHQIRIRNLFFKQIDALATGEFVELHVRLFGQTAAISMRARNRGDYLIIGELVRGGYQSPEEKPSAILDGGANIGAFAIRAAFQFPGVPLQCYEPESENFALLQRNIEQNRIQADLHHQGLWSRAITLYFHAFTSETGFVDDQPPGAPIHCVLPLIEPNSWIKLDIEGAEYEVIPALLGRANYPHWISMEVHHLQVKGDLLIQMLADHGYRINGQVYPNFPVTTIFASLPDR